MKAFALLAVLLLALAGCSGKHKDGGPTTTSSSSSSSTSHAPAANGTVEVLLNRTTPNGAAPLQVNFTLDAAFKAGGARAARPSGVHWNVTVGVGNGTAPANATGNATGNGTRGASGTALPANVTLNLTAAGNFTVLVTVSAPGFATGNASFQVAVLPGGPGTPAFLEDGEADESQWTVSSNVFVNPNADPTGMLPSGFELDQENPSGPWVITDAGAHGGTHAWTTPYPDNYRSRMTSVPIKVPAAGATLTYWVKGGAESNGVDGIHVLAGPDADTLEEVAYTTGAVPDWTAFTVDLPGGETVLQFRMDSDISCSNDSPPAGGSNACGAGYDGGGFLLDDITVL
jgi:hypothetical protein